MEIDQYTLIINTQFCKIKFKKIKTWNNQKSYDKKIFNFSRI